MSKAVSIDKISLKRVNWWLKRVRNDRRKIRCILCGCKMRAAHGHVRVHKRSPKHLRSLRTIARLRENLKKADAARCKSSLDLEKKMRFSLAIAEGHSREDLFAIALVMKQKIFCPDKIPWPYYIDEETHETILSRVLVPNFCREMREDIGDGTYSLYIYVFPYVISDTFLLCFGIRYMSKRSERIVTSFLSIAQAEDQTPLTIANVTKKVLGNYHIPLQNLLAIAVDSTECLGDVSRFCMSLSKLMSETLILPDLHHSLEDVMSDALSNCLPDHLEFLVSATHEWFQDMPFRNYKYEEICDLLGTGEEPLKKPRGLWLSKETAVRPIVHYWDHLMEHFRRAATDEHCYKAELLTSMYETTANKAYIMYVYSVLKYISKEKSESPLEFFSCIKNIINHMKQKISATRVTCFRAQSPYDYTDPLFSLDHEIFDLLVMDLESETSKTVREKCTAFASSFVKTLSGCLPHDYDKLEMIGCLDFGNCTRMNISKDKIKTLAKFIKFDSGDLEQIGCHWNLLPLVKWEGVTSTEDFWNKAERKMNMNGEQQFAELAKLARKVLLLPLPVPEAEEILELESFIRSQVTLGKNLHMIRETLTTRYGLKRSGKSSEKYEFSKRIMRMAHRQMGYPTTLLQGYGNYYKFLIKESKRS